MRDNGGWAGALAAGVGLGVWKGFQGTGETELTVGVGLEGWKGPGYLGDRIDRPWGWDVEG